MQTLRQRVIVVINATTAPITAREIAHRAGMSYLQAVFALNALNNYGLVQRIGAKSTARWTRKRGHINQALALERAFRGFFR